MKLTVLVDNNTNDFSAPFLLGESGVAYLLEEDGKKILFDTGCGDVFLQNAQALGIDLHDLDMLVLSHGHEDHTWGIDPLIEYLGTERSKKVKLVAHPDALLPKLFGDEQIGVRGGLADEFDTQLSSEPVWLTDKLCFLGQISRANDWEGKKPVGETVKDGERVPDMLDDDTALVYKSPEGLVVITGCSHAGICNTIEYAKQVCREERIVDVIGGFHLLEAESDILQKTGQYLASCNATDMHPCHCTDLAAKLKLNEYIDLKEVGSGLVLEWE